MHLKNNHPTTVSIGGVVASTVNGNHVGYTVLVDRSATIPGSSDTQERDQSMSKEFTYNTMVSTNSDEQYHVAGGSNNNMNNKMNGIMVDTNGEPDLYSSVSLVKKIIGKINEDKDLDDSNVSHSAKISPRECDKHQRNLSAHGQHHDLIAVLAMTAELVIMNVGLNQRSDRELTTDDEEINAPSGTGDLDNGRITDNDDILTGGEDNDVVLTIFTNECNEWNRALNDNG